MTEHIQPFSIKKTTKQRTVVLCRPLWQSLYVCWGYDFAAHLRVHSSWRKFNPRCALWAILRLPIVAGRNKNTGTFPLTILVAFFGERTQQIKLWSSQGLFPEMNLFSQAMHECTFSFVFKFKHTHFCILLSYHSTVLLHFFRIEWYVWWSWLLIIVTQVCLNLYCFHYKVI